MIEFVVYIVVVMTSIVLLKIAGKAFDISDEDKQTYLMGIFVWPIAYPFVAFFGIVLLLAIGIINVIERMAKLV